MAEESLAKHVTRFDGKNFLGWKFQVNAILAAYDIIDVVNGTRVMPADATSANAKTWVRDNAKAMFLISTMLEYEQLEPLVICTTAKEMWDRLSVIHEQRSASSRLLLMQKFHEYRMNPSDSVI